MTLRFGWIASLLLGCACASTGAQDFPYARPAEPRQSGMKGQGWFGLSRTEVTDVDLDSNVGDVTDVDDASMPVLGGAIQRQLGSGENLEMGIEGGINFGWEGNVDAVVVGGGGIAVAGSTDIFLTDLFAGPYAAWHVGQKGRLYVAGGLLVEWALIDLDFDDVGGSEHVNEDGFGGGYYARTGFEWEIGQGTSVGFGVRFVESTIDPGGKIDDVDLRQVQYLVTLTRSI